MRIVCIVLLALLSPAMAKISNPEELSKVTILRKALPAVVRISGTIFDPNSGQDMPMVGSGFFYDNNRVVTAYHVVQDIKSINIELYDGRTATATVVSVDQGIDLAILSVKGVTAPAKLTFETNTNWVAGSNVVVIGSPFGQKNLASFGNIAGEGIPEFSLEGPLGPNIGDEIGNVIFVDAVITSGNSGGPVLNGQGKVIGIADAVVSESSIGSGFGVVLPGDLIRQSIDDLEKFGIPQRGNLGINVRNLSELDPLLLQRLGLVSSFGVMVEKVERGFPGDKSGLKGAVRDSRNLLVQLGDVILAINNRPIKTTKELNQTIARYRPGQKVNITVWRKGKKVTLVATMVVRR